MDSCRPDDVVVCAAAGSSRAAVWGELLSMAARNAGCVGAVVDGVIRDIAQMAAMKFPVYAAGTSVYDAMHRIKVVDFDVDVELAGVRFQPGSIVVADADGVVVVPQGSRRGSDRQGLEEGPRRESRARFDRKGNESL